MYEYFQKLMDQRGVKPIDVSKATGIRQALLSDWKAGRYQPKIDKLQKIADYFGVNVKYLQTGQIIDDGYYLDPETAKAAQEIFENEELSLLFDAARDASPEDLRAVHAMLLALKRKEEPHE